LNMKKISFNEAIAEALAEEMQKDSRVFLMGENPTNDLWNVTSQIFDQFGKERIIPLPISEGGFVCAALGCSLMGQRPVVELMYGSFSTLAFDAIAVQSASWSYVNSGSDFIRPMVIRAAGSGTGAGHGAFHATNVEATLMHCPGIKVVYPSTPFDAKGLMKAAVRDNNPVVFFESVSCYSEAGEVPEEEYLVPIGKAKIVKEGKQATVVSYGNSMLKCIQAEKKLAEKNIDIELLDLRTLAPLDVEAICDSVKKTGLLITVEDGVKQGGVGSEISAVVSERCADYLKLPPHRIAGADCIVPAGKYAESFVVPSVDDIIEGTESLINVFLNFQDI